MQNRVRPDGEIVAEPWRGLFTGNRGCLHDDEGRLGRARWRHQNWVCCRLEFRGRHRPVMPPGRWTALFFWDEAAALSAGHRPCGECRHADYRRFMKAWQAAGLPGDGPRGVDRILHASRVTRRREKRAVLCPLDTLPPGTFVTDARCVEPERAVIASVRQAVEPVLWQDESLWEMDHAAGGYRKLASAPAEVAVLTPLSVVEVLTEGYRPHLAPFLD